MKGFSFYFVVFFSLFEEIYFLFLEKEIRESKEQQKNHAWQIHWNDYKKKSPYSAIIYIISNRER